MECLLPYLSMVTVPHIMVGLEKMLDYRDVGLERFHCICICTLVITLLTHSASSGNTLTSDTNCPSSLTVTPALSPK